MISAAILAMAWRISRGVPFAGSSGPATMPTTTQFTVVHLVALGLPPRGL